MKIETNKLEGAALDWAVAKSLGWHVIHVPADANGENAGAVLAPPTIKDGEWVFPPKGRIGPRYFLKNWSSDWSQGGPIIDRYLIEFRTQAKGCKVMAWAAHEPAPSEGATHLVAACRAVVTVELGEVVEVPDGLVEVPA